MPQLANSENGYKALVDFNKLLEDNHLLHLSSVIAFKKYTKNFSKNIFFLLPLIGLPTHHSKYIAFQTPANPIMEGIVDLHNDIMVFLVFILIFVLYLLIITSFEFKNNYNYNIHGYAGDDITHNTPIEII